MIAQRPPEFIVEPAVTEDAELLAALHARSWRATYFADRQKVLNHASALRADNRIAMRRELIEEANEPNSGHFYHKATGSHNRPVGFIYGTQSDEKQEIEALYVDPYFQGKGVGRGLVEAFIDWADRTRPIELGVAKENLRAQRFYTSMGFYSLNDTRYFAFIPETTMVRPAQKGEQR